MRPGGLKARSVRRASPLSPSALVGLSGGAGLLTTLLILGSPYLVFGYHSPALHLVLDSVDACVAFLLSYLLYGRYTRRRRLQDLMLAGGLLCLAVAGLGLSLTIGALDAAPEGTLDVWLPLAGRVLGAGLVVGAALAGDRAAPARRPWWVVVAAAGVVVALVALVAVGSRLPTALDASPPTSAERLVITGHPLLLLAHALTAICFFVAAVLFMRQATRRHDELLRWLGPACMLAGFARVDYVLFPSLYSDWLYTGDLLRTGSYLLFLVGAGREISQYWTTHAQSAVLEDRRRLARELHDGVVQELGYIKSEAQTLAGSQVTEHIIGACDVALDEARAAIDALGRPSDEPLGYVLHRAARQVADRYDGRVVVELDDSVSAHEAQRHALVRITREAVSNALRHGDAHQVHVRLERDHHGGRLVVADDGRGFDSTAPAAGTGYGLTSMQERAQALPGSFSLRSAPGTGTTVEVRW